jgi:hypothetical protein
MNRRNLIELMATVAATVALWGCASAAPPQHTADLRPQPANNELGTAHTAWAECVRAAIPRFENPQSPSEVVARAAMQACSSEYTAVERVLTHSVAPTCGRDPDCTRVALAKAQREAIQDATADVVTARVRVAGAQVLVCQ